MKIKLFLVLLLFTFMLTGCGIIIDKNKIGDSSPITIENEEINDIEDISSNMEDNINLNTENEINSDVIKKSDSEIFDNNLKCQEYLDYYKENFFDTYLDDDYPRVGKPRGVTLRETQDYVVVSMPHVFYSPITNSCLGTFGIAEGIMDDYGEHYYSYTYKIDSIFGYEHASFSELPYNSCYSEFEGSKYNDTYNNYCDNVTLSEIQNIWRNEIDWLMGK